MPASLRERVHRQELLDRGTGSDRDVAASMADLRRMNRWLGGARILRGLLRTEMQRTRLNGFCLLDAASGSADLAARVRLWHPGSRVVACDVQWRHLRLARPEDRAGVQFVCADVFRAPFPARSFDFVIAALFAHHFTDAELPGVLQALATLARHAVIVSDLDRHPVPLAFMHAAWPLFARSPITRYDSDASIRRGFKAGELERAATEAGFQRFRASWHFPFRRSLVIELD